MKIELWGRGGEIVVGSVSKEKYVYWKLRSDEDDDLISEALQGDLDYDSEDIPEEMRFDTWYDLDDLAHETGPAFDTAGITVTGDDGTKLWEGMISDLISEDGAEELAEETDDFYFSETAHDHGLFFYDAQKGQFESYTIEGVNAWDPKLLKVGYVDIEGNSIITNLKYDGKDLEGNGDLSTDGKGWHWEWLSNREDEDDDEDLIELAPSELRFCITTGRDMFDDNDVIKVFFATKDEDHPDSDNLFVVDQVKGLPGYIYDRDITRSPMENHVEISIGLDPEKVKQDLIASGVEYYRAGYEVDERDKVY